MLGDFSPNFSTHLRHFRRDLEKSVEINCGFLKESMEEMGGMGRSKSMGRHWVMASRVIEKEPPHSTASTVGASKRFVLQTRRLKVGGSSSEIGATSKRFVLQT